MIPGVISTVLIYTAALIVLTIGGNAACRLVLKRSGAKITHHPRLQITKESAAKGDASTVISKPPADEADEEALKAGRVIGSLERILISIGLIAQSWEVMVAVIALKTVARYQELDERIEAEYFLIGSLVSILWAVAVTVGAMILDSAIGINVSGLIRGLIDG